MQNQKSNSNAKFSKSFWPLAIIVIVSMVAGGLIYSFAYNNMLNDDINSMFLTRHKEPVTDTGKTAPAKTTSGKTLKK
jgi:hypothetical protein